MNEAVTHALTVRQPYAWGIAHGRLAVAWLRVRPPACLTGQRVAIYAPVRVRAAWEAAAHEEVFAETNYTVDDVPFGADDDRLARGCVVAVATLAAVVEGVERMPSFGWPPWHRPDDDDRYTCVLSGVVRVAATRPWSTRTAAGRRAGSGCAWYLPPYFAPALTALIAAGAPVGGG